MILSSFLPFLLLSFTQALASAAHQQQPLLTPSDANAAVSLPVKEDEGVGRFSKWARETKVEFLKDLRGNKAGHWTLVFGNEGGGASLCSLGPGRLGS